MHKDSNLFINSKTCVFPVSIAVAVASNVHRNKYEETDSLILALSKLEKKTRDRSADRQTDRQTDEAA